MENTINVEKQNHLEVLVGRGDRNPNMSAPAQIGVLGIRETLTS